MNASEKTRLERLTAVISLGLVAGIRAGVVNIAEAEQMLFSPHTMRILKDVRAAEAIIQLIHAGTELEDFESLLPHQLQEALDKIEEGAVTVLRELPESDSQLTKWIENLITG